MLGDIVIAVDRQPVSDVEALQALLATRSVGAECAVEVIRGGRRTPLTVRLGQREPGARS
jgi:S1-C subfamily serine protease